jgi:hypothetical protein
MAIIWSKNVQSSSAARSWRPAIWRNLSMTFDLHHCKFHASYSAEPEIHKLLAKNRVTRRNFMYTGFPQDLSVN